MSTPIFFISTANNSQAPLPHLERESENIYRLLSPAANQQRIQIHREPFATVDNIAHHLIQFKDRVVLFHYGGHADSQHLIFRDQSANADGIAQQLAQQKSLKLVFLNGCSTFEQVKLLLELGVPAVIATSTPVNDKVASDFANSFYTALVSDHSIKEAFEMAAAIVKTRTDSQPQIRIYRDSELRTNDQASEFPWGLYVGDERVLNEQLIPAPKKEGGKRNVVEDADLKIKGNAHIGTKGPQKEQSLNEENVIKRSTLEIDGDFHLGNDNS